MPWVLVFFVIVLFDFFNLPPPRQVLENLMQPLCLVFCGAALFWNKARKQYSEKKLKLEFASQNTVKVTFIFTR